MKAAVVYLRVSTDRQAERGLSIPAQREACLAYAQKSGYEVVGEYVDAGESARSADRPQLQDMLTRCRKDKSIKAVIIHKVDRIARNTHDHAMIRVMLKQAGVELCSVTENINGTPEGEFLEYIMAAMAQFYSRNLARETLKGMNQRAQNGLWNAPPPLGYTHKQEGQMGGSIRKWVEPHVGESLLVRTTFELYASGQYTLHMLATELSRRGLRTRRGNLPGVSVLARMLRRKFYIGVIEWNGVEAKGLHQPIIEPELFDRVQKILRSRGGYVERHKKHIFILRGLAVCGECGARITGEKHLTKGDKLIQYYRCSKRIGRNGTGCQQDYVTVEELESRFSKVIAAIELTPAAAASLREKIKETAARQSSEETALVTEWQRKIEQCKSKEARLVEKLADGVISDEDYGAAKTAIEKDRAECEIRLLEAAEGPQKNAEVVEMALSFATRCRKAYASADVTQKKVLVSTFFQKIVVKDGLIQGAELNPPLENLLMKRLHKTLSIVNY